MGTNVNVSLKKNPPPKYWAYGPELWAINNISGAKHGRPVLLGYALDIKLQQYIIKVREGGGVVSSRIVMAAARGLLLAYNRNLLVENGGHNFLNQYWVYVFLQRMNFVQIRATLYDIKE